MPVSDQLVSDLIARVNALEAEVRTLRHQLAETPAETTPAGSVNRRQFLQRGVQAAAATVAAGVLLNHETSTASATHTSVNIDADSVTAHSIASTDTMRVDTTVYNIAFIATNNLAEPGGTGISARSAYADAIRAVAPNGYGIEAVGYIGVRGLSSSTDKGAIHGIHSAIGHGVIGEGGGDYRCGVWGINGIGLGVKGEGIIGVHGISSQTDHGAVWGLHNGLGYGVVGDGKGTGRSGILGRNADGEGVRGEGKVAVRATSTASGGYGLVVEGGKAQVRIAPAATVGKPTSGSHSKGELFVDKNCNLYICTVAGSPGTWRKLSTTAA